MRFLVAALVALLAQGPSLPGPGPIHVTSGGGSPVTLVQMAPSGGGSCSTDPNCASTAFSTNTTAGNDIGACYMWAKISGTGNDLSSITSTNGDTFTVDTATKITVAGAEYNEIGVECGHTTSHIAGGPDQVVCHASGTLNASYCTSFEITAINASNPDKTSTGTGTMSGGTNPPTTGAVTTTANGEFAIVATIIDDTFGSTGVFVAGSGFTIAYNGGGGANDAGSEYQAQSTAGAITGNFTSPGNMGAWAIAMETLKP